MDENLATTTPESAPSPAFVAGDLALDFLNTRGALGAPDSDLLSAPHRLVAWLARSGSARVQGEGSLRLAPPLARRLLSEARVLRSQVAAVVESVRAGRVPPPGAIHALNRVLASSAAACRLVERSERFVVEDVPIARTPLSLLAPVALAAGRLLASAEPRRIRRCDSSACGLWFLDTSRSGRRRWCSMATCGNRAKAARHYRKHGGSGTGSTHRG